MATESVIKKQVQERYGAIAAQQTDGGGRSRRHRCAGLKPARYFDRGIRERWSLTAHDRRLVLPMLGEHQNVGCERHFLVVDDVRIAIDHQSAKVADVHSPPPEYLG